MAWMMWGSTSLAQEVALIRQNHMYTVERVRVRVVGMSSMNSCSQSGNEGI